MTKADFLDMLEECGYIMTKEGSMDVATLGEDSKGCLSDDLVDKFKQLAKTELKSVSTNTFGKYCTEIKMEWR